MFTQTVDGLYLPIFRYTAAVDFYPATYSEWFCSMPYAEIHRTVVDSKISVTLAYITDYL